MIIVKVQLSLATNAGQRQVLVYNEDRSLEWEGPASKKIIKHVKGAAKSFWYAKLNKARQLVLDKPAPWQDW